MIVVRQQVRRVTQRHSVAGLAQISSHVVVEDGTAGGAVHSQMYRSRYRVEDGAGDCRVDVDETEQTAQTEECEHDRLLEVDRVFVTIVLDDDALRHGLVQRVSESTQQERVMKAAAGYQKSQRSRVR